MATDITRETPVRSTSYEADYVVTTFYRRSPEKRPIVHAYGPYLLSDARALRKRFLAETEVSEGALLNVSVCRMIG